MITVFKAGGFAIYDKMEDIKILSDLFRSHFGVMPSEIRPIAQAGGDRRYFRLVAPGGSMSAIGTCGDSLSDCIGFVALDSVLLSHGIPVPEIYAVSPDRMHYLQKDLGDVSLFSILGKGDGCREAVKRTLSNLVRMQLVPERQWGNAVEYGPFCRRQVMWDLNYFKYEFLKPSGVKFDEDLLEDDFEHMAQDLVDVDRSQWGFMMRDCQSRNVMMCGSTPYFIDFQGGRLGPSVYDAVSFLWQAKAPFSEDFRIEMFRYYAEEYAARKGGDMEALMKNLPLFRLFRMLQVLGAYGFRGLVQRRAHFIESISPALRNLESAVDAEMKARYHELGRVCGELAADRRFDTSSKDSGLTVTVFSFSYKRGYPDDFSGNGGGFMFDCRGMHNPGRYDKFKPLTGMDDPVIGFLKERGEADRFAANAMEIVSPSVECYLRRGFNSLQIGFGCTGGRHRSVYCAEAVAKEIRKKYPDARVVIVHREQDIRKEI